MRSWGLDRFRRLRDAACREEGASSSGSTTLLLDGLLLGRLAVDRGLLAPEALEACVRAADDAHGRGEELSLQELLVGRKHLTAEDWAALAAEVGRGRAKAPRFQRYETRSVLGEGATSVVYRAWDRELNRPVAVKVLRESVGMSEVARQRFRREAQTAAALAHPNLVTVYDAGEVEGQLYLVMELVEGRPLSGLLSPRGPELRSLVEILWKASLGVAAAHAHGIVHRDLKPANVLVGATGEPKVADFGLAHLSDSTKELTRTGATLGTPLYMSPEQVAGRSKEISPRTDVYALGAMLYEIVAGAPPHTGESIMEIYGKIARDEPRPPRRVRPELSKDLETIALKALEKEPGRRYASAGEFAADLRRHLNGEPIEARPTGPVYRTLLRIRKNPVAYGLGAGVLIALVVALAVWRSAVRGAETLRAEREARIQDLRDMARVSLDAALRLRRSGDVEGMGLFLPRLQAAYEQAARKAPDLAEVEYLMGRMHRALMRDADALGFQERALRKDPDYGPAIYEKVILLWMTNRRSFVHAAAGKEARVAALREEVLRHLTRLLDLFQSGPPSPGPAKVGSPNLLVVKGLLAFHQGKVPEAQGLLRQAVQEDPSLEEGWEALAQTPMAGTWSAPTNAKREELYLQIEDVYTQALLRDRGYEPHWEGRGFARSKVGQMRDESNQDPMAWFERSEEDYAEALRLNPKSPESLQGRAMNLVRWTFARHRRGEDPKAQYESTCRAVDECLRLGLDGAVVWYTRGKAADLLGHYRSQRGMDPRDLYAEGERYVSEALTRHRLDPVGWAERGEQRLWLGKYRDSLGEDAVPTFAGAESDFSRSLELDANSSWVRQKRAETRLRKARLLEKSGRPADAKKDYGLAVQDYEVLLRALPGPPGAAEDLREARRKFSELPD
jgi:serine/threonine-protein kinase